MIRERFYNSATGSQNPAAFEGSVEIENCSTFSSIILKDNKHQNIDQSVEKKDLALLGTRRLFQDCIHLVERNSAFSSAEFRSPSCSFSEG